MQRTMFVALKALLTTEMTGTNDFLTRTHHTYLCTLRINIPGAQCFGVLWTSLQHPNAANTNILSSTPVSSGVTEYSHHPKEICSGQERTPREENRAIAPYSSARKPIRINRIQRPQPKQTIPNPILRTHSSLISAVGMPVSQRL